MSVYYGLLAQVGVLKCNVSLSQEADEALYPDTESQKIHTHSLAVSAMKLEVEAVVVSGTKYAFIFRLFLFLEIIASSTDIMFSLCLCACTADSAVRTTRLQPGGER